MTASEQVNSYRDLLSMAPFGWDISTSSGNQQPVGLFHLPQITKLVDLSGSTDCQTPEKGQPLLDESMLSVGEEEDDDDKNK